MADLCFYQGDTPSCHFKALPTCQVAQNFSRCSANTVKEGRPPSGNSITISAVGTVENLVSFFSEGKSSAKNSLWVALRFEIINVYNGNKKWYYSIGWKTN